MKKLFLMAGLALFSMSAFAQDGDEGSGNSGFRVGLNGGIPVGDFSDWYSFTVNLDVEYDWDVSEDFTVGVGTGYTCYFDKEIDGFSLGSFDYVPIYGSVDFNISNEVSVGGDVGYAVAISGSGGDLLYRFQFRYEVSEDVDVQIRYNSVSGDGASISYVSFGVGYNF